MASVVKHIFNSGPFPSSEEMRSRGTTLMYRFITSDGDISNEKEVVNPPCEAYEVPEDFFTNPAYDDEARMWGKR